MALSFVQYVVDGSTNSFAIPFPYIKRADISVSFDGEDIAGAFSFTNDSTLATDDMPTNGTVVEVRRTTERAVRLVDYVDGSTLTEDDLDLANEQAFYIVQEALDSLGSTLPLISSGAYSAENRQIKNLANPTDSQDAVTLSYYTDQFLTPMTTARDAAAASATAAASSATAAAASATAAASSATSAATHDTSAGSHATAAGTSETNAATSATAAAASATAAASSATAASGSATTATTQAGNASTSATAAAASATAASGSATTASTQATNAATSATAAAASASTAQANAGMRRAVRVASTANVTISNPGTSTFDGVAISSGDRVLLKDQSTGSQNGIYDFNGSGVAMTRSTDSDTAAELPPGTEVFVSEGTIHKDRSFVLTTDAAITLGSTSLTFVAGIKGAATNETIPAGYIGETMSSVVTSGSPTTGFTNNGQKTVTSLALTKGKWLLSGNIVSVPAGSTTTSAALAGFHNVADTLPATELRFQGDALSAGAGLSVTTPLPARVVSLSADETWYMVARYTLGVSTMGACGFMHAVRIG